MVMNVYMALCPYSDWRQQADTITISVKDSTIGLQMVSSLWRLVKRVKGEESDWGKGHHLSSSLDSTEK